METVVHKRHLYKRKPFFTATLNLSRNKELSAKMFAFSSTVHHALFKTGILTTDTFTQNSTFLLLSKHSSSSNSLENSHSISYTKFLQASRPLPAWKKITNFTKSPLSQQSMENLLECYKGNPLLKKRKKTPAITFLQFPMFFVPCFWEGKKRTNSFLLKL